MSKHDDVTPDGDKTDKSIQSKGGKARADKLTSEEKKAIASKGAAARWNKPKAEYHGSLPILNSKISCAVLSDERRVISHRGLSNYLGVKGGGQYWEKKKELAKQGIDLLPEYVSAEYLRPYIDEEVHEILLNPINYNTKGHDSAQGFEASILPKICDIWIKAQKDGALKTDQQKAVAEKAYELLKGFSEVGITALVDEATGYQEVRQKGALAKILEAYLERHARKWELMFQLDYYREIYRLKGWEFKEGSNARPGVIGTYTNNIIYDRLHPGIKTRLNELNPKDALTGRRRKRNHQFFTGEVGIPELREHLSNVTFLMKTCATFEEFLLKLDKVKPKVGETLPLDLEC